VKDVDEYVQRVNSGKSTVLSEERLSNEKLMAEYIFLGLRTREGIHVDHFQQRFRADIEEVHRDTIQKYLNLNLLVRNGPFLRLTREGLMIANTICAELM
jgi:oxygen-independent coproporphyrinogen-3 oxidase